MSDSNKKKGFQQKYIFCDIQSKELSKTKKGKSIHCICVEKISVFCFHRHSNLLEFQKSEKFTDGKEPLSGKTKGEVIAEAKVY